MKYTKPSNLLRDLLKRNPLERGRLLGLDVGDKYVGLAVSDPDNKIASPLSVLIRKKTKMDLMAQDFQKLITEFSLAGFIVGYPFDGQRSCRDAVQVKIFIDDLCKTGKLEGLKYTFWDECFTSKNVELLIKPLKLPPVLAKTVVDKFAAVGILQGYLDYLNRRPELDETLSKMDYMGSGNVREPEKIESVEWKNLNPEEGESSDSKSLPTATFEKLVYDIGMRRLKYLKVMFP